MHKSIHHSVHKWFHKSINTSSLNQSTIFVLIFNLTLSGLYLSLEMFIECLCMRLMRLQGWGRFILQVRSLLPEERDTSPSLDITSNIRPNLDGVEELTNLKEECWILELNVGLTIDRTVLDGWKACSKVWTDG